MLIERSIRYLKQHGFRKTLSRGFFELNQIRKEGLNSFIKKTDPGYVAAIDLFDDENYKLWSEQNEPDIDSINKQKELSRRFELKPKISIITPVFNPDRKVFVEMIESVVNQTYPHWELCLSDASTDPSIKDIIEGSIKTGRGRIKVKYLDQNKGIAGNSNEALSLATGDYVALLDHDDALAPFALYEVVKAINEHPEVNFIYSDRDIISYDGKRLHPFFKPDWSPDYLLSQNYLCHINVFRKQLIDEVGGVREGYEGSQDYDLVLRATELTDRIIHIPKILYHWRIVAGSASVDATAKPYAYDAAIRTLEDAAERRGWPVTVTHGISKGMYDVKFIIKGKPKVSIVIPSEDCGALLKRCIHSILEGSGYTNYELVVVGSGEVEQILAQHKGKKSAFPLKLLTCAKRGSFSEACNYAVSRADGEYILFLRENMEVASDEWIEHMIGFAQREVTGAVGAKLLSSDGTVYAAGLILDEKGNVRRSHHLHPRNSPGYNGRIQCVQNVSAVSACVLVRKEVFEEAGGFDPRLSAYAEIDLCLKLREMNYLIVYNPHAELYYHGPHAVENEHGHERPEELKKERELFVRKWGHILKKGDPFYSPNLTGDKEDFSIRI